MNYFYTHLKGETHIGHKKLKNYLNDFVHKPDQTFDIFYIPKRTHYCHANFLITLLNHDHHFFESKFIFMDYVNKNTLKKALST